MELMAKGGRGWGRLVLLLGILSTLLLTPLIYSLKMPVQTYCGPLAPLSAEGTRIRDRLATHVQSLASDINERNLWRRDALLAAVSIGARRDA